jgi:predicted transcriptional regulator
MPHDDKLPKLSAAELDLMKILWSSGQSRARDVQTQLNDSYQWAYSTTRTMLERMVRKGYLKRATFHGVILYDPVISRPRGLAHLVRDFSRRVLEADPASVVSLFAGGSALSADEVAELRDLLDQLEEDEP